jgi:glutamate-ammonia-ligase adenylyltransferase
MDRLCELKLLSQKVVDELKESYTFLRRAEHWVQLDQNRQTQKLPKSKDAQIRLSLALGFEGDVGKFFHRLEGCSRSVHGHFRGLFGSGVDDDRRIPHDRDEPSNVSSPGSSLLDEIPPEALARLRTSLNALSPALEKSVLEVLRGYAPFNELEIQEKILARLHRYFSQVSRRPGLARLFHSPATWFGGFCRGLSSSELLAALLTHHPSLVEGVATAADELCSAETWEKTSVRLLQKTDDYGEGLEWIRRLKNERILQLALADLGGHLSHEILEYELSFLADFVIRHIYERVSRNLGMDPDLPLAVMALGRLGSMEMSYLSDLDLVFVYLPLHHEPDDLIPGEVVRLVQRFMNMLSTPMQEGPGYAVDARLRPTGNFGPLIVTRSSWLDYYQHQADLWEMQALLRLRFVAGNAELGNWIEEQARSICYRKRDPEEVWARLCHLRQRMQRERSNETGDQIDIKLGLGGLADLDFLAQGSALTLGHEVPSLKVRSVRSSLKTALENSSDLQDSSAEITTAFEALRSLEHRLRLHNNFASSRMGPLVLESLHKLRLWPPQDGAVAVEDWQDLIRLRRRVRKALQVFCPDL